jgi:putative transposase
MLSPEALSAWYEQVNISQQGRAVIDRVRSSQPARRVGGGRCNVSGRYPSQKMGLTIQFESHRVELAVVYEFEHDPDVLEYYDQPPSFKLNYESNSGRRMGVLHTPDYFVIRGHSAGWEECKTGEALRKLCEHNPNRYRLDPEEHWRCPPGEEHARGLGLYYRVRSSREINWVFQRNIQFLEDYFRCDSSIVASSTCERVAALVTAVPGMSLEGLFRATRDWVARDDIYALISSDRVYVDLHAAPLAEPSKVAVFPGRDLDSSFAQAASHSLRPLGAWPSPLSVGCVLMWDGTAWKVINVGQTTISLLREDQIVTEVPLAMLEALAKEGRVAWSAGASEDSRGLEILKMVSGASDRALRVANERLRLVREGAGETPALHKQVAPRTLRRWNARYREAEEAYGCGFLGLLPNTERRGNATCKIPEATKGLMQKFIAEDYERSEQKSKFASWISLRLACERQGAAAPSYRTFCLTIGHRPLYDRALKRQGRRAAYAYEPFYWYLEPTTPRHGDRPFEIAHIDHTQLDVELVCSETGHNLGRPWMTVFTDSFSRRILAAYVTFDPPSYRSCMMVVRECVRPARTPAPNHRCRLRR